MVQVVLQPFSGFSGIGGRPGIDIAKKSGPGFIQSRGVPPTRNATIQTPGQLLSNCHRSLAPVLRTGENEVIFDVQGYNRTSDATVGRAPH